MILYALACQDCDHEFEGWFASSEAFERLAKRRQIDCPECGGHKVGKQIMAPAVRPSDKALPARAEEEAALKEFVRKAREHVSKNFDYVGDDFAEEARAMYYGEQEDRPIWGETTADEREALAEEGIAALPLPAPFAPKPPKAAKRKQPLN
ncbi:DUF1178 family protein [Hyphomonas sp. WL0036]|uniref:DUF1178 family protein n=1 Tax=Hyphomonas sediminis TaxID=2866160 RepID=UPI001C823F73|nr:DUF1178 family protein [Hyphomonas sediminis]